jgi:hypothetical protein
MFSCNFLIEIAFGQKASSAEMNDEKGDKGYLLRVKDI